MAAVARYVGVAPSTLRTWDRRYGLGPAEHRPGRHRRYSSADVATLQEMRRLLLAGVTVAEAARIATDIREVGTRGAAEPAADAGPADAGPADAGPADAGVGGAAGDPGAADGAELDCDISHGGGRVLRLTGASAQARGLARAAMSLDAAAVNRILGTSLERRGVAATWQELLVPVLISVGDRWAATGEGVDVEHLLSECAMGALRAVGIRLENPVNRRPVLLAAAEGELHSLPLHVVAAGLAERRVACHVLGASMPRAALADAVRRSGPSVVFLWAQRMETSDPAQLSTIPAPRPAPVVVAGGPGWSGRTLPAGITRVHDFAEAVERLGVAAGV